MGKFSVGILGATGVVGQKFVELLADHPWFELTALAASERSVGKEYRDAVQWKMKGQIPERIAKMRIAPCRTDLPCDLLFSALDNSVAEEIEEEFACAGYFVVSNASSHRISPSVPLLIPEVNSAHLQLLSQQRFGKGGLVTNPNCSVIGIAMALKPLIDLCGVEAVNVVTLQAISGAGHPGVSSLDILDNVIPFIEGEEEKIATEPLKIFGEIKGGEISNHSMRISAQCTRVPVSDGHLACLSVKLGQAISYEEIVQCWREFKAEPQRLMLPSAPKKPLIYFSENDYPQPKLHRDWGGGMSVAIGRLRPCTILDWKFVLLAHNTLRGAAGSALLNAELLVQRGCLQ